jgi:hypothetical protein
MAILSEAYSNDPFERRVQATYHFVREILSLAAERREKMLPLLQSPHRPDSVAVRQRFGQPRMEKVIAEITTSDNDGSHGFARRKRSGQFRTVTMPVWDRFVPRRTEPLRPGYLIPDRLQSVIGLLRRHGVVVTRFGEGWAAATESFTIDSVARSSRPFEGHHNVLLEGHWVEGPAADKETWWHVSTSQPLGVLAAYILEPASEDGVVAWNFLDADLVKGDPYPILRLRAPLADRGRQP